jgi:hypothetical protein
MISVKCPACGLVDWNVGDCKRCGTSLVGLSAEEGGDGYFRGVSEWAAQARAVRTARRVMAACAVVVLGLAAVGVLYLAHKPAKKQWFWSFYRHDPTVGEIFAHDLEASGGAERIAKLRSFRAEGQLRYVGSEAARVAAALGGQVTFVMHAKAPDKTEMEVEFGAPSKEPGSARALVQSYLSSSTNGGAAGPPTKVSVRRGFDGKKGWEYVERTTLRPGSTIPSKLYSSRELDDEEVERMKRSSQLGLTRLGDEYTTLKLDGHDIVTPALGPGGGYTGLDWANTAEHGREAYVVRGVSREGKNETFYFDIETGLLLRHDFEAEDAEGELVKVECRLEDYKQVNGLTLPHSLYFKRGEESMTMTFEKYIPNDPTPDSTFEAPEATE